MIKKASVHKRIVTRISASFLDQSGNRSPRECQWGNRNIAKKVPILFTG